MKIYVCPEISGNNSKPITNQKSQIIWLPSSYIHTGRMEARRQDTVFSLVINYFAIKFTSKESTQHLLQTLKDKYEILVDWKS